MDISFYIIVAVGAYLMGSIPTGYLAAKAKGIDIRTVGSGNIGATNVFRILGKGPGIIVLLVDFLKGFLACWLAAKFAVESHKETATIIAGVAAILGHNYTCWLKFKGGKGVATTAGVLLAMFWVVFVIALGVFLLVFAASRYVSLASITAAASLPVSAWFFGGSRRMFIIALFLGGLAIYKHKANIKRLLAGTENRIGKKKDAT